MGGRRLRDADHLDPAVGAEVVGGGEEPEEQPSQARRPHARVGRTLEKIRHGGDLVFCNPDGSKLRPGQFHEILWAAQRKSGLRRIKWHELRHSFASILTTGGAPLRIVQSLLGHSTIRMTERYAHLAPGQSAGFMHLLSTVPSKPSSSGQRSGQFDPKSDPN
jgi:site-specific recombinase XerC